MSIPDRAEWLARRRSGIGGSDVAAIVGLSPWASPWSVWADKTGLTPLDDRNATTDDMEFGQRAEPMLTQWFQDRTGLHVAGEQMELARPDDPWMKVTVDGFVFDGPRDEFDIDAAIGNVEHKKTADAPAAWDEQIPLHYQCQAQWTMAVTGLPRLWFSVIHLPFGRATYATYEFERDEKEIAYLVEQCRAFWHDHVLTGTPPPADGSDATTEALGVAWGETTTDPIQLDDRLCVDVETLARVKRELKTAEVVATELENRVKAALGEHEIGEAGAWKVTWKPQARTSIDAKALRDEMPDVADKFTRTTSSRVLRITAPKGEK